MSARTNKQHIVSKSIREKRSESLNINIVLSVMLEINTLRPRRNEQHFADDIFKRKLFSSMKMFEFRLKFHWSLFPRVQLTIFQHWVQVMAWRRIGDKPLSEPKMVRSTTHICVTRPQWVKTWNLIARTRMNGCLIFTLALHIMGCKMSAFIFYILNI